MPNTDNAGRLVILKNRGEKIRNIFTFAVSILFILALLCFSSSDIKTEGKTRKPEGNTSELAEEARYHKGVDGIWRIRTDLNLSALFSRVKKELKYTTDVLKMDDGSLKLNGIKAGSISMAEPSLRSVK